MALVVARSTFSRLSTPSVLLCRQMKPTNRSGSAAVVSIQVAGMKATYGEPYPYEKPYPYETRNYTILHEFFDNTTKRMNENSKVIIVEGNIGVGKREFARRLAKDFDLKVYEPVPDDEVFKINLSGFDVRELDHLLPETARQYDLKKFLSDPKPEKGTVGRLQIQWYERRFNHYCRALYHLFNTGQGVVLPRSVYGDHVFTDAFRKIGWVTPKFVDYFNDLRANSICELIKPHIVIYLDAPVEKCMERIKQRKDPREVGAPNLNEKLLHAMEDVYKGKFLPNMRRNCEVVEIDWSEPADENDMDVIVEEIQRLKLESEDSEDPKFQDWAKKSEDELCNFRKIYGDKEKIHRLFSREVPWECPEVMWSQDDTEALAEILWQHPAVKYEPGWAPELGDKTLLKIF